MARSKGKLSTSVLDQMLGEASWLLSHADALAAYGRQEEADAELARAAACEEQVACFLEADGQELEAAIHRVSAGSCHEQLGQYPHAVTLLRAALPALRPGAYQTGVEQQLKRCLAKARRELSHPSSRKSRKPVSTA